jgi:NTE family protein
VATEAASGQAVVMKNGFLPQCIRASMAIPTIFTPVRINGSLMVDGGMVNNFPVRDVIDMGAEIVIGGYTGFRLLKEEELNNAFKIFYQSQSYNGAKLGEKLKKECLIVVDNTETLGDLNASDFNSATEMIARGEKAAREMLPQLIALANAQKAERHDLTRRSLLHQTDEKPRIHCIRIEGADANNMQLIFGKLSLIEGLRYSNIEIKEALERVYATRAFERVTYTFENDSAGKSLIIHVKANQKGSFKTALHYDSDQPSGILLNLTYRNLLPGSRLLATIDFSQLPKLNLSAYKYISKNQQWWLNAEYIYEQVPQNIYFQGKLNQNFTSEFQRVRLGLGHSLGLNKMIRADIDAQWNNFTPDIDPKNLNDPPSIAFSGLQIQNAGLQLQYLFNGLNRVLFPTKGTYFRIETRMAFLQKYRLMLFINDTVKYPTREYNEDFQEPRQFRFLTEYQRFFELGKKVSLYGRLNFGGTISLYDPDKTSFWEGSDFNLLENFLIGGNEYRSRSNWIPFFGLRGSEYVARQYAMAGVGAQWEPARHVFVLAHINVLASSASDHLDLSTISNLVPGQSQSGIERITGGAIQIGYQSLIGPIKFTVATEDKYRIIRTFLSIGFRM